jgi:hypothetical protein
MAIWSPGRWPAACPSGRGSRPCPGGDGHEHPLGRQKQRQWPGEHHTRAAPSNSAHARSLTSACGALDGLLRWGLWSRCCSPSIYGLRSPPLPDPPRGGPGDFRFQQSLRLSLSLPALRKPGPGSPVAPADAAEAIEQLPGVAGIEHLTIGQFEGVGRRPREHFHSG